LLTLTSENRYFRADVSCDVQGDRTRENILGRKGFSDQRILGAGDFVEEVLKAAHQADAFVPKKPVLQEQI